MENVNRRLRYGLLLAVGVAAPTALAAVLTPLRGQISLTNIALLMIAAVAPVAFASRVAGIVAAASAALAYDYFWTPRLYTLNTWYGQDLVGTTLYFTVALVISELANRNRRNQAKAEELASEQTALRRVATLVAGGAPPCEVFSTVAHELASACGASIATVLRYEDDATATIVGGWCEPGIQIPVGTRMKVASHGVTVSVLQTGAAARTERFDGPPGSVARFFQQTGATIGIGSPIVVEGRLWGVAVAASPDAAAFPPATEHRIVEFAELVATAIANAETQAQLIESRARVIASADETRRRIERDLHDGAQQRLVSLALQLRTAQAAVPPELGELGAELEHVTAGLTAALDELRDYARGIHPAFLSEHGLGPALKTLARRCPVPVNLDVRAKGQLPEQVEAAAYYVVSEALTNAAKYANASEIAVRAEPLTGVLHVSVRDDGTGGADFSRGTGLVGLKDRVEALGGRISVHSPRGAGTTVRAELPLTDARSGDGP